LRAFTVTEVGMTSTAVRQQELLTQCAADVERVDAEARRLTAGLSEAQLQWNPPDGGWSVAQVFAHLVKANASYFDRMRAAIAAGPRRETDDASWRPTVFGGLLYRSLEPSNRRGAPSPKMWRPASHPPADTLDNFLATQATLAGLIRDAAGVDLVRTRLSSPVSRLIRVNLGDALRVLVVHDWRHLGQVERVLARPGFPTVATPAGGPGAGAGERTGGPDAAGTQ
jgi:uncharacterized damage-inducible protein DinB